MDFGQALHEGSKQWRPHEVVLLAHLAVGGPVNGSQLRILHQVEHQLDVVVVHVGAFGWHAGGAVRWTAETKDRVVLSTWLFFQRKG